MIDNGLVSGILYVIELVGVYSGGKEAVLKASDAFFMVNMMADGVRVEDVILLTSERHGRKDGGKLEASGGSIGVEDF